MQRMDIGLLVAIILLGRPVSVYLNKDPYPVGLGLPGIMTIAHVLAPFLRQGLH